MPHRLSRRAFLGASAGALATSRLPAVAGASASSTGVLAVETAPVMIDNTDPAIIYGSGWESWSGLDSRWHLGTARSSATVGAAFEYTHSACTRLRWWCTRGSDRATANVFIDGVQVAIVNTYSPALVATSAVFDSGPLVAGGHTIRVVVATSGWIECDAIEVTPSDESTFVVEDTSALVQYTAAPTGWDMFTGVAGRSGGTVHSSTRAGAEFRYSHVSCTRLVWRASTAPDRGIATVYVDGQSMGQVDLYSTATMHQQAVFDTGPMALGAHSLRVVVSGTGRSGVQPWIELDHLEVTGDPYAPVRVENDRSDLIRYGGQRPSGGSWVSAWTEAGSSAFSGGSAHWSETAGSFAELSFRGSRIRWVGGRQPNHGSAEVFLDNANVATVDTYAATTMDQQLLFERTDLNPDRLHTIRVVVLRSKNASSSWYYVNIDAFDCDEAINVNDTLDVQADAELAQISSGTKPFLAEAMWQQVVYSATVPESDVVLTGGPLRTCFLNNVDYVLACAALPWPHVTAGTMWINEWPSSNEGRLLMGAGHALRWHVMLTEDERSKLTDVVTTHVDHAKVRQDAVAGTADDGFALNWRTSNSEAPGDPRMAASSTQIEQWMTYSGHERANYDRAMWTRGMIAAIKSGNGVAGTVLRRMYDWFNRWHAERPQPVPALVAYSLGAQGHIGSTLTYHSPVGTAADLLTAERFYVQDWWLAHLANAEPLVFSNYALNRPHSYLVIGLESYVDHYLGTGAQKYLDAALGGWQTFRDNFLLPGGGTAIIEDWDPFYARTNDISRPNNEFDGAIFWVYLNQRLLQLFPTDERFAAEIERCIYNVALAQQDAGGMHGIRYHGRQQGVKESADTINTCCEVNGTGLYSRLPELLYSIGAGGIYVNMWEGSSITWVHGGSEVTLTTETTFPYDNAVTHTLQTDAPVAFGLAIRVPRWAVSAMTISVNGQTYGSGSAGSYVVIDRTWSSGDTVSYELPIGLRLTEFRGVCEISGMPRYAVEYGPILLAYTGSTATGVAQPGGELVARIHVAPDQLVDALQRVGDPATALAFAVDGDPARQFVPYWTIGSEPFGCYPIVRE